MVYVDPLKLEAHQLSVMDVVNYGEPSQPDPACRRREDRSLRLQRLCQQPDQQDADLDQVPLKTVTGSPRLGENVSRPPGSPSQGTSLFAESSVLIADVGKAEDSSQIQYNKVRINGQPSV